MSDIEFGSGSGQVGLAVIALVASRPNDRRSLVPQPPQAVAELSFDRRQDWTATKP